MNATILLWGAWAILLSACTSPVEALRPTTPEPPTRTIFVSLDTWHAMIAFPRENAAEGSGLTTEKNSSDPRSQSSALSPQHLYEEWGYAEQGWYLKGQQGLTGVVRALFWPTEGIVEVGHYSRVWAERTPQLPSDLFTFRLTEEGYQRLQQHLRATLSSEAPVVTFRQSAFYSAKRSYHLFHTCHQYAALALREAGLRVSPFWAFNRTSFASELRRATRIIEEHSRDVQTVEPR